MSVKDDINHGAQTAAVDNGFSVVARISALLILLGLGLLFWLSYLRIEPEPWWVFLGLHLAAVLISVGLVELLFEVSVKKAFFREVKETLLDLFSEDIRLAKNLNPETRKRLVNNTLLAQLGIEIGPAVYSGLVERYFGKTFIRHHFHHRTFFEDLPVDIELGTGIDKVVLPSDEYLRLSVDFHFRRAFETAQPIMAFSVSNDVDELYSLFRTPECLFREQIDLRDTDRQKLMTLLEAHPEEAYELLQQILDVGLELDGNRASIKSFALTPSGRSVRVVFDVPGTFTKGAEIDHHVTLNTVICKQVRHYTVWLVEPSANPRLDFYNQSKAIVSGKALHFLTTKKPFDVKLQHDPRLNGVSIAVNDYGSDHEWVFPPSSVVFTWDVV